MRPTIRAAARRLWLVATGRLHPEIGLLAKWSIAQQAITALLRRQVRGNVVLTIVINDPQQSSRRSLNDDR